MATTIETLLVRIEADTAKLRGEMQKAGVTVEQQTSKMKSSFDGLKNVIAGVGIAALTKQIIDAGAAMQQLEARMRATTGGVKQAGEAMSFLRGMAKEQSVDLLDLADGYNRLLPAVKAGMISMDDMRKILRLANDNIKAFGLSSSETQGLFLGLSQALGSGTVTMEDLRQVTDRLPGTLNSMAEAVGTSVGEFKKMIATGEVTADMIKGPLIEAFQENEGAAKSMANTYDSAMIQLKNSTRDAFAQIAKDSHLMEAVSDIVTGTAKAIENTAFALQSITRLIAGASIEIQHALGLLDDDVYNEAIKELDESWVELGKSIKDTSTAIGTSSSGGSGETAVKSFNIMTKKAKETTKEVKEQTDKLQEFIRNLKMSNELLKVDERTRTQLEAVMKAQHLAMEQGNLLTQEQIDLVKQLADENYKLSRSYQQVQQSQSFMSKAGDTTLNVLTGLAGSRLSESLGGGAASQLLTGLLSGGGGSDLLGSVVNDFGNSIFGTGIEGLPWTGTPLSSYLGAAGMGFTGGGLIADMLGLKQTGGSFGGGAGAALGMALGGPIGAGIGTLAGSLLGGQFGGTPHPAGTFGGAVGAGGGFSTLNLLSKHMGTEGAQSLANQVAAITSTLGAAGIGLEGTKIFGGYDPGKGGGFLNLKGGDYINFDQENAQEVEAALKTLTQQLLDVADITNNEVAAALEKMSFEGKTLAQVLDDIQFQAAIPTLREAFNKSVNLELLKITDPTAAARQQIMDKYASNMEQAKLLGADTGLLERLRDAELKQLSDRVNNETQLNQELQRSADSFQRLQQSIDDTLNSLLLGNNSLLSPTEQFNLALSNFRSLAGSTDAASLAALPGAAQTLAAQNRSFYGTGPDASAIFNEIVAGLQGGSGAAGGQAAALLAQQNQLLAGIAGGIAESNNKVQILMAESSRASYAG